MARTDAYRVDLRALALLAQSQMWIVPCPDSESFPVAVVFHIPGHLETEARALFPPPSKPTPGRPPRLRVLNGKET